MTSAEEKKADLMHQKTLLLQKECNIPEVEDVVQGFAS
jgi:hypothetical protein